MLSILKILFKENNSLGICVLNVFLAERSKYCYSSAQKTVAMGVNVVRDFVS